MQHAQEHEAILKWLTPIEYPSQQRDIISRRQKGTGQWFLNSEEFRAWVNRSRLTLFCPGIPGVGKTMMSSIIVDHLQTHFANNADVGIAYVYCSYQPQQEQRPEDFLSALLKQLIQPQPTVPRDVKALYENHRPKGSRPSSDEVAKVLHVIVRLYSRVFIIVDALDEYHVSDIDGHQQLLSEMFNLLDTNQVNLFATSRPLAEIISQFDGCLRKEIRAHNEDILRYLNGRIPQLLQSKIFSHPDYPDVCNLIRSNIMRAADGMYVYLSLRWNSAKSRTLVFFLRGFIWTPLLANPRWGTLSKL